jgi:GNAT superfamily N-acetyltransferase
MEPSLRAARAEDARRVAELLIDTRSRFMPYAPSAHPEPDVREWVASHLVPTGGVVVAEIDGRIVGAMATAVEDETSWITQMAVDPGMVGRGIGSMLLARATETLTLPIRLYKFQQNFGAQRFYERHGFQAIEFTDGEDNEEKCPDVLYELHAH